MIELTSGLLAGGDLITLGSLQVRLPDSQHISSCRIPCTVIDDYGKKNIISGCHFMFDIRHIFYTNCPFALCDLSVLGMRAWGGGALSSCIGSRNIVPIIPELCAT